MWQGRETASHYAAATEMARTAGRAFNPLMIHGGIGLGKTHLLEGINHGLKQFHPKLQIVQLTAEAFTNGFLDSMRSGTLSGFRARFRGAGGLIVDDIQFLAAKRATMIEFLYTFNALYDRGAPIILAADQHPRQIPRLTDELVTRFVAGMVARIEPPDVADAASDSQSKSLRPRSRGARTCAHLHRRAPACQHSRARGGSLHGHRPGGPHRQAH